MLEQADLALQPRQNISMVMNGMIGVNLLPHNFDF